MLGSNIYMSDIIGELYTTWKDCLVILNGGTGCGKSHFVINVLIPCYVSQNKRILYLCNREKLESQVKPQINRYPFYKCSGWHSADQRKRGKAISVGLHSPGKSHFLFLCWWGRI